MTCDAVDQTCEAQNIASVRRLFQAISDNAFAAIVTELAAPNFVRHDLTGAIPGVAGQDGARNFIAGLKVVFPDLRLQIADIMASGDKVVVRFVATGTHGGSAAGVQPTRRRISFNNINIYRFEDGRVAETWQLADGLGVSRQIGAPLLGEA